MCQLFTLLLLLLLTLPQIDAANVADTSINRDSIRSKRSIDVRTDQPRRDEEDRIYHQGDLHDSHPERSRVEYESFEQIQADTAIDHSLDGIRERLQPYNQESVPDFYDPDELSEEIAKQSIVLSSVETERQDRTYASASSGSESSSKHSAWIAHGTIAVLVFGLLVPASISSALFRDFLPEYWIYLHVFLNVATFSFVTITVGVAFTTMNSLGDKNEGHLKELHHVIGLFLLLVVTLQTANGFLRPPREFLTEDEEDRTPGAIHSSDWGNKFTPRSVWHLVHRVTGAFVFALGTWQIQSGMKIYARKYNGADWGSVYLGYIGWLVFVIGGAKLWAMRRENNKDKNQWNAEDELFMDPDD
jgi:hypothetical protein